MILKNVNDTVEYMGKSYYIGEDIVGTSESLYDGLFGNIIEIRTDADKETDNQAPDIYCEFYAPVFPEEVKRFENKVSLLYGKAKTLGDIALDRVVMAPEMIKLLTQSSETRMIPVFTIVEDWAAEDDYGHSTEVYFDYDLARKNLCKKILGEKQDGCIKQCDETELVEDYGNDYYEVHEEGFYSDKHYLVSIQKHDVPMNVSDMVKYINN